MENNSNIQTIQICRTCMKEHVNKSLFFNLDFTHADTKLTIRQKLYDCIPELDPNIVPNAVICYECAGIVTSIYKFKSKCLQTEMKIHKYIQHIQQTDNVVDLIQVLQFHHQPYGNLRTELKTEASNIDTCNGAGEHTESTQSAYLMSLEKTGVQITLFNKDDNLITYNNSESTENLELNDGSIALNNIPEIVDKQDDYIKNVKKDTPDMYQCYTCGHKTGSKLKLIVHIKCHTAKNQHHMQIHTGEKPFKCQICKYQCSQKGHLKIHMRIHTAEKPFKCQVCEHQFGRKSALRTHLRIHTGEKPFKCQVCEYQFGRKNALETHMHIHTTEKPFKCHICNYQCSQKGHLKIPIIGIHTGENPFKCQVCEYQFGHKSALKTHMRIHTGEKPFKCQICNYQCSQKGHLKIHMRIHTGEKPFKCQICEYQFSQKSALKTHLRIHTGEKPFNCQFCEYSCNQKISLKVHMRIHTREMLVNGITKIG